MPFLFVAAAMLFPGMGGPDPKKLFKEERDALHLVVGAFLVLVFISCWAVCCYIIVRV